MAKIEDDAGGVWEDPSTSNNGGGGAGTWMKLKEREEPFRVRLVSSPEVFRKHWAAFKPLNLKKQPISPALDVNDKDEDIAWAQGGWVPGKRYASLVIDRETGTIRILEAGAQVFKEFGNFKKVQKINPCGPNGPDWLISVGRDSQGKREYSCVIDVKHGMSPFTPEELKMIDGCKIDLKKLYKRATSEEVRALWHQLPEDKRVNPNRKQYGQQGTPHANTSQAAPSAQPAPQVSAPKEEDDGGENFPSDGDDVQDDTFLTPAAQQKVAAPVTAAAPAPAQQPAQQPAAQSPEKKAATLF